MITDLVEFCYTKKVEAIPKGVCLILNKRSSAVDAYQCQHFSDGCPSYSYFSNRIYEHQSCVSIEEGCFLADPYCGRTEQSVSTSRKTTTLIHVYNTKEFIQTNSIKTDTPDPEFYFFISIFLIITIVVLVMCGYRKELSKRCKQVVKSQFSTRTQPNQFGLIAINQ